MLQALESQQLLATQLAELKLQSSSLLQQKNSRIGALELQLADAQRQLQAEQHKAAAIAASAAAAAAPSTTPEQAQEGVTASCSSGSRPASAAVFRPSSPHQQQQQQHHGSSRQSCCKPQQGHTRPASAASASRKPGWSISGAACSIHQHYREDLALAGALLDNSNSSSSPMARVGAAGSRPSSAVPGGRPIHVMVQP